MMRARTPPPMYMVAYLLSSAVGDSHPAGQLKRRAGFGRLGLGTHRPSATFERRQGHATTRRQEGHEASTAVRARQGVAPRARHVREPSGGDRGAHGEQGARSERSSRGVVAALEDRHLVGQAWRDPGAPALAARPDAGPALRGGAAPEHPQTLEDDEERARAGPRRAFVSRAAIVQERSPTSMSASGRCHAGVVGAVSWAYAAGISAR